ncbi:hypothetical protein ACVWWK_002834 [Bradyrhizobium sp. LB9.1b]
MRGRGDREFYPHRIGRVVLVLDLGFGERGLLDHAPHHRLGAAIERAVGGKLHQLARDLGLGRIAHGGVGMVPVADHAEALEFLALHAEPVRRVSAALFAEIDHRGTVAEVGLLLALLAIMLLLDFPLDRQTVAVPARHVVGIEAEHLLALGDEILQDLVQRRADMDVAIGIGRAVMQHELVAALGALAQLLVEAHLVPALEDLRLALRQAGAHQEFGLRQEQGLGIVFGVGLLDVGLLRLIGHGADWLGSARERMAMRNRGVKRQHPGLAPSRRLRRKPGR